MLRRLVSGVSWLAGAELLRLGANAAIAVFLARRTGAAAFGAWTFAIAVTGYPLAIVEAGLTWIGTRDIARDPTRVAALVRTILPIRLALALAGTAAVVTFLFAARITPFERQVVLAATASLFTTAVTLDWVFYGLERPSVVALASLTRTSVFATTTFLVVDRFDRIWWVPLLQASAELAAAAVLGLVYRRRPDRSPGTRGSGARDLVRQSAPLAAAQLMRAVSAWTSVTVVALVLSASAAGSFGAAQRLSLVGSGFAALYFYGYLPLVSRAVAGGADLVRTLVSRSLRLSTSITVPAAAATSLLAAPLTHLIFGAGYEDASPVLSILVWTIPLAVMGGHFRHALIASRLTHLDLAAVTGGAITTVALNVLLVGPFGLRGAALASLAGEVVVMAAAGVIAGRAVLFKAPQPT